MEEKKYSKLYVNGEYYKTQTSSKYEANMLKPQFDLKQITAFIPGTVREILVTVGQKVTEGQDLLILEAMKMRNRVKCPMTGKIKTINVKENQSIPKNFVLIEIE